MEYKIERCIYCRNILTALDALDQECNPCSEAGAIAKSAMLRAMKQGITPSGALKNWIDNYGKE